MWCKMHEVLDLIGLETYHIQIHGWKLLIWRRVLIVYIMAGRYFHKQQK